MCTSWAVKLLMELPTADKTHSPKRETQISHDLKKDNKGIFVFIYCIIFEMLLLLAH